MAYALKLSYLQKRLYTNICDIYKPTFGEGVDPADTSYVLHSADVPCLFYVRSAVDIIVPGALVESSDLMTADQIHLHEEQAIDSRWVVLQKTRLRNGKKHGEYGKSWMVSGDPQRPSGSITRETARVIAYINRVPYLPAGIPNITGDP
jgi:hypothetical protein